jgi:hypothetical protein
LNVPSVRTLLEKILIEHAHALSIEKLGLSELHRVLVIDCLKSVIDHVLDPDAFIALYEVFKGKVLILTGGDLFSEEPLR